MRLILLLCLLFVLAAPSSATACGRAFPRARAVVRAELRVATAPVRLLVDRRPMLRAFGVVRTVVRGPAPRVVVAPAAPVKSGCPDGDCPVKKK